MIPLAEWRWPVRGGARARKSARLHGIRHRFHRCEMEAWRARVGCGRERRRRRGNSAVSPLPSALRGPSGGLFIGEYLLGQLDIALGSLGTHVVGQDRLTVAGSLSEPDISRNDGSEDFILEEIFRSSATWRARVVRSSNMVRRIPSILRVCWKESRIRSSVTKSSEMPSKAKNSHWMGISTESAASRSFSVRRSSAGGQSIRMYW